MRAVGSFSTIVLLQHHSVQNSLSYWVSLFCCVCVNLWLSPASPPPLQLHLSSLPVGFVTFCYADLENGSSTWRCAARPWVFEQSSSVGTWRGDRENWLTGCHECWMMWAKEMVRWDFNKFYYRWKIHPSILGIFLRVWAEILVAFSHIFLLDTYFSEHVTAKNQDKIEPQLY